jgi:cytidine deaminase
MINYDELVKLAYEATKNAYTPYSNFNVGAALLTKSGKIYTGCNVECAAYGATNCAERTAIFKAVSEGEKEFAAIAIVSSSMDYTYPCGTCRQVIAEFADESMEIILAKDLEYKVFTLEEMLPYSFTKKNLK